MNSVELVKKICKDRKIPISKLERDLDFANGYLSRLKEGKFPSTRLKMIADYLSIDIDYLLGIEKPDLTEEAQLQQLFEAQLRLYGWTVTYYDPTIGKPCIECMEKGFQWWANDIGDSPEKMCDQCLRSEIRYILSNGDHEVQLTPSEYDKLIQKLRSYTIDSIIGDVIKSDDSPAHKIPVLRRVAAGPPLDSIEEIIDWEELPSHLAETGSYFGLKIQGDSMMPTIANGDIIICREQPEAEDGQIVVALVNGNDGVCKRLKKYPDGTIALMSDNTAYQPMYFSTSEIDGEPVRIKGIVKEMRRKF